MKWLDFSINAKGERKPYVVEVGEDRLGDYNLPSGLATRASGDGKKTFTIVPGKHLVADERDVTFSPEFVAECQRAFDKHPADILNDTGLDLMSRKAVLDPFRKEGNGLKAREAAISWAAANDPTRFEAWINLVKAGQKDVADEALVAAYNARK